MSQQVYIDQNLNPVVKLWLDAGQDFVLEEDGDLGHGPCCLPHRCNPSSSTSITPTEAINPFLAATKGVRIVELAWPLDIRVAEPETGHSVKFSWMVSFDGPCSRHNRHTQSRYDRLDDCTSNASNQNDSRGPHFSQPIAPIHQHPLRLQHQLHRLYSTSTRTAGVKFNLGP